MSREFRGWVKPILFLSSYVPLFIIMALEFGSFQPRVVDGFLIVEINYIINISHYSVAIILLCIVLTLLLYRMVSVSMERGVTQKRVDNFKQRNELLSTYLLVYVFVFIGLDFTKALDIGIFIVFFGILGVLQIHSEMLHVNPMLGIRGYRIYEVQSDEEVLLVISKSDIEDKLLSSKTGTTGDGQRKIDLVHLGSMAYLAP